MCLGGSTPDPQPLAAPPIQTDEVVAKAGDDERRRRASASGSKSTILTSGKQTGATAKKTLLGD